MEPTNMAWAPRQEGTVSTLLTSRIGTLMWAGLEWRRFRHEQTQTLTTPWSWGWQAKRKIQEKTLLGHDQSQQPMSFKMGSGHIYCQKVLIYQINNLFIQTFNQN